MCNFLWVSGFNNPSHTDVTMTNAMLLVLVACLVTGAPMGVCRAEMFDAQEYPKWPDWATPMWREYASHIVASEARGVPQADIVIACTIIRDVERGYHLWNLYPARWHGYGTPDELDRKAIRDALLSPLCVSVPDYRFVGNSRDALYWRSVGIIKDEPVDLYIGPNGSTVVGVK